METASTRSWRLDFARSAAWRREQDRFARAVEERRKDKLEENRIDEELVEFAASAILATAEDIDALRVKLDRYDADTVEALIENQKALDASRDRIEALLGKAYVLPDGRHVFKTEDGLRVFDEHGVEIKTEEIDPTLIEDWRPKYEEFFAEKVTETRLAEERGDLFEFQKKLDDARERLDDNNLTKGDIAEIEADLEQAMPLAVRRKLPGFEEHPEIDLARDFGAATTPKPDAASSLRFDLPELNR